MVGIPGAGSFLINAAPILLVNSSPTQLCTQNAGPSWVGVGWQNLSRVKSCLRGKRKAATGSGLPAPLLPPSYKCPAADESRTPCVLTRKHLRYCQGEYASRGVVRE